MTDTTSKPTISASQSGVVRIAGFHSAATAVGFGHTRADIAAEAA